MKKYIYNHTSFENAFEVDNYPWGFRLKTKVRYWIEDKEGFGQRFVKRTLSPKTGYWCNPKYSIYYAVMNLYLDDNDYLQYEAYYNDCKELDEFINNIKENLTEFQIKGIKKMKAVSEIMKDVKFKCVISHELSFDEKIEEQKRNDENMRKISNVIDARSKTIEI